MEEGPTLSKNLSPYKVTRLVHPPNRYCLNVLGGNMNQVSSNRIRLLSILLLVTGIISAMLVYRTSANNSKQNRGQAKRVALTVLQSSDPVIGSDRVKNTLLAPAKDGQSLYSLDTVTGELTVYQRNGKATKKVADSFPNVEAFAVGSHGELYLAQRDGTVQIVSSDGRRLNSFHTVYPWSIAALGNGNVVVASPFNGKNVHLYNSQGLLLASFGDTRTFDADKAENEFLNQGRVVVGSDNQIYYVSTFAPLPYVMKFSSEGQLLAEFPIEGEAIDLQVDLTKQFISRREFCNSGGVTIITSATVSPDTGHLWLGMNSQSTQGTVYEYDDGGNKLREFAFLLDPNTKRRNVTHVKDIAVSGDALSVLTSGGTYDFKLSEVLIADAWKVPMTTAKTMKSTGAAWANPLAGIANLWAPAAALRPGVPQPLQTTCPAAQDYACIANCPQGTQPNPADCGAVVAAFFPTNQSKRVIEKNSCTAKQIDSTPGSATPGGCTETVTWCDTSNPTISGSNTINANCTAVPTPTPTPTPTPVAGTCGGSSAGGCNTGFTDLGGYCGRSYAFQGRCAEPSGYDPESCTCPDGTTTSPIVVDVDHSGFAMTDAANGVVFNLLNDGVPIQISWTAGSSTNAFLALDRNGNGTIDNGAELFGNLTPQPPSPDENGFLALAEFDKTQNGGNGDGVIDNRDSIFNSLRLWQDRNHNGISEPAELHTLPELAVDSIATGYKLSKKTDQYGNQYRYRAKVDSANHTLAGRWAWDVFLRVQ